MADHLTEEKSGRDVFKAIQTIKHIVTDYEFQKVMQTIPCSLCDFDILFIHQVVQHLWLASSLRENLEVQVLFYLLISFWPWVLNNTIHKLRMSWEAWGQVSVFQIEFRELS